MKNKSTLALLLLSVAGLATTDDLGRPLIRVAQSALASPPVVIAYGDTRFTDPQEKNATDPKIRRWLVDRIAAEKPDAVLISGDLPWNGGVANDYAVFHAETAPWRDGHILVLPALGNHEFHGELQACLGNWWKEFPQLRDRRWYSAALGDRIRVLNLDSNAPLQPGSPETAWIKAQLDSMPASVQFVFFNLHHPPVADVQAKPYDDHNPRPNEIALDGLLRTAPRRKSARFIVCAGHIHNYERFLRNGIVYLVSGGGGAKPRPVVRALDDLYQDADFPNYHYVKFTLHDNTLDGEMIRVADPAASAPSWQLKDRFQVSAP